MMDGLATLCRYHCDEVFIATGSESRDPRRLRAYRDAILRKLGVNVLDIFYLEYVALHDDFDALLAPNGALNELKHW